MTTADDIAARVYHLLDTDPDKPAGLTILDSPELPQDPLELPVLGVYLEEGERQPGDEETERTCVVRVEVRAMGPHPLVATRAFREWAVRVLMRNFQLVDGDVGLARYVKFMGFQPFGAVLSEWMAGALLDFEYVYTWRPE